MPKKLVTLSLTLSLFIVGCSGSGDAKDQASRDVAIDEVLGYGVSSSVSNVESSWFYLRDAYVRWVRFECDETTLSNLLSRKEVRRPKPYVSFSDAPGRGEGNPNAPEWWNKAKVPKNLEEYEVNRSSGTSATGFNESIYLWVDHGAKTVYVIRHAGH